MPVTIDQLRAFVKQHALTSEELPPLSVRARDPRYWLDLCPAMTIGAGTPVPADTADLPADVRDAIDDYQRYGHCAVHEAFAPADLEAMKTAVMTVHAAGWPMIFAFVYDAFWTVTRAPKLDAFVRTLVGAGYQPTISFWINYVPPQRGGSGFPPHMDDVRPGHHAVTCWLPLTPATADNGCVYVIEKRPDDPGVTAPIIEGTQVTVAQLSRALAHVRALPVDPGSFLAWPHDTIHWGGMFFRGDRARLALSWHLTSADYENIDPALRLALVPDRALPSLDERLRWLSQSLLRFRGREAILERFAPLARHLMLGDGAADAGPSPATSR